MRIFIFLLTGVFGAHAAAQVGITAHFVDLPAGVEIPATPAKVAGVKGAQVLSSPRITVLEEVTGNVEVTRETPVPGGTQVALGVSLNIKTSITERGSIWFSGNLRDRSRGGGEKTEKLETVGFATREWYFSGYTFDGGTVVIRTMPATAHVVREGKSTTTSRELVAYLKFDKVPTKPAAKKASAATKSSTKKTTSSKSGSRKR